MQTRLHISPGLRTTDNYTSLQSVSLLRRSLGLTSNWRPSLQCLMVVIIMVNSRDSCTGKNFEKVLSTSISRLRMKSSYKPACYMDVNFAYLEYPVIHNVSFDFV
jgi:hypothetical protein